MRPWSLFCSVALSVPITVTCYTGLNLMDRHTPINTHPHTAAAHRRASEGRTENGGTHITHYTRAAQKKSGAQQWPRARGTTAAALHALGMDATPPPPPPLPQLGAPTRAGPAPPGPPGGGQGAAGPPRRVGQGGVGGGGGGG